MALDDDRFDTTKCHHHQESKSGSFVRRKFVEARLGFYEQWCEIGVGSPDLHGGTHQSADGQERGRFQCRRVLSALNCKVDQRECEAELLFACSHTAGIPEPPTRHRKPWESAPWYGKGRRHYRFGLSFL